MNVFGLHESLIRDYRQYIESFIRIQDQGLHRHVQKRLDEGALWPEPLVQLNPAFESGLSMEHLLEQGLLHPEALRIFRLKDRPEQPLLKLHRHQEEAIRAAAQRENYVVTTGTGSGKSLTYIIPIVNYVLKHGSGKGIQAIIVYPMNALANSQMGELDKFINGGYPDCKGPVRFARYTGQEGDLERGEIQANPPDILLTNYVMLDLILTRPRDKNLIRAARGLKFLVLDELHTYRGRQGADVALLVRRLRERLEAHEVVCIGTSATLASNGGREERKRMVAQVASRIFGLSVRQENVIGETLRRTTQPYDFSSPLLVKRLRERIRGQATPQDIAAFSQDPLASWVEQTLGLKEEEGVLVRQTPRPIKGPEGAAAELAELVGLPLEECQGALQECLLAGYRLTHPESGLRAFAFRLHQFISRGDTVYASLAEPQERHVTLQAQQYVPGSREQVLLPLAFCRECGQEFYTVWRVRGREGIHYASRKLSERFSEVGGEPGFLYPGEWPASEGTVKERVPEDWLDPVDRELKRDKRKKLPQAVAIGLDGREEPSGRTLHYLAAPFEFCPCCGVAYGARQASDFGKLATLGSEGRSTATTVLSLSAVLRLRESELPPQARKLLSFTDNRQDASLQSGHFNDFVQTGLLRSAVYWAVERAGEEGLRHNELAQRVFEALGLGLAEYASNPEVKFSARQDTDRALRDVLGYRIYRDLLRGWRITAPNLEQVDLLRIGYDSLGDLCRAEEEWQGMHPVLLGSSPKVREKIAKVLLDYLRRELAIKVDYLNPDFQERMRQASSARLIAPWALEENEKLEYARVAYPRSSRSGETREAVYVSPRGSFGQYLRRSNTFPGLGQALKTADCEAIIQHLFQALSVAGLVEPVDEEGNGYQVAAASFIWRPGDGTQRGGDPLRVRLRENAEREANRFFTEFYRLTARNLTGVEAGEHTAQVPAEKREEREEDFREGRLPVLYCSPTMELGVDISTLNMVHLRNVPPTPANYAQRSGRAGRSGSPALVLAYASSGNSHDQYFFRRPKQMVAGVVTPPRLDLTNEELIRSHLQAIWLASTGADLGRSLAEILEVEGEEPSLALKPSLQADLERGGGVQEAMERAERVLSDLRPELAHAPWFTPEWPKNVLSQAFHRFEEACRRWQALFRAAREQFQVQSKVILDASRTASDKDQARRLRAEAESQLRLLTDTSELAQSDFYSYRYFASEGFLPGYSFPRLPLSAFIPARKGVGGRDNFLSRPRFLAITEFGPFSTLYYEGSKYVISKVILPPGSEQELRTLAVKRCEVCGYLHSLDAAGGPDLCVRCRAELPNPRSNLLRMQNVSTVRRERINSDEEERQRLGYQVLTGISFPPHGDQPSLQSAEASQEGQPLAELTFSQAASIWRMNLGWAQRKNRAEEGFLLDPERGAWLKRPNDPEELDEQNPTSRRSVQVIPFVEDRKNALLLTPRVSLSEVQFFSLLSALKSAIQVCYQLEEGELAGEVLPDGKNRRELLFYEAAEGGAGVLRQLVADPEALPRVARTALDICHFAPDGTDLGRAAHAMEDCEAACYDCLMSYNNQRIHPLLDRKAIRHYLLALAASQVATSPVGSLRSEHLNRLLNHCESGLEREFLEFLEARRLALPSRAQVLIEEAATRVDFLYDTERAVIYVDGPHHLYPDRQARDRQQERLLRMKGYTVLRLAANENWEAQVRERPDIFGGHA